MAAVEKSVASHHPLLSPLFSGMMLSIAENIPRCFYSSDLQQKELRHLAKLMPPF